MKGDQKIIDALNRVLARTRALINISYAECFKTKVLLGKLEYEAN